MLAQDILRSCRDHRAEDVREGFRALVEFPDHEKIIAAGPGPLLLALYAVCDELKDCTDPMSDWTCCALGIPRGQSYGSGAKAALQQAQRLAECYKTVLAAKPMH